MEVLFWIGVIIVVFIWFSRNANKYYASYAQYIRSEIDSLSSHTTSFDTFKEQIESMNKNIITSDDDFIVWEDFTHPELTFSCSKMSLYSNDEPTYVLNVLGKGRQQLQSRKDVNLDGFSYSAYVKNGVIYERKYSTQKRDGGKIIQTVGGTRLGKEFSYFSDTVCIDNEI